MGPCRLLKTIFAQFLGKYRVVSALFGKIERLTFTGTFDAFQHLVKSHSFKQICFPHRSEMGVLKSFPEFRFPKNVHSPISQADRQNALPVPRPIAPQDLEPRLRPESGILCFNRSISGGFGRLRHVKTLLPFVRTFLKGPPTGLIRFSSSAGVA